MTPAELARCYARCIDAATAAAEEWGRRDPGAGAFAEWLVGCWQAACPAPPAGPPAATSRVGHDPAGLRWFAVDGAVLAYAAGHAPGCYRIPPGARPPAVGASPGP